DAPGAVTINAAAGIANTVTTHATRCHHLAITSDSAPAPARASPRRTGETYRIGTARPKGADRSGAATPHRDRSAHRHEVAAVRAVGLVDGRDQLFVGPVERLLELADPRLGARDLFLEVDDLAHSDQAHAFVGELLDAAQQRDVTIGVPATTPLRARRFDEALAFVDAQRLRMHARELRGHGDDVQRAFMVGHASITLPDRRGGFRAWSRRSPRSQLSARR